jgi:ubiquinone/menaquinone biosynthesis C-methylase UbiE
MEVSEAAGSSQAVGPRVHEIDWDAYASQYDLLATNNPCYRQNIEYLREVVRKLNLGPNPVICDLGAGTGNFICALARDMPDATFVHVDADSVMNRIAIEKYAAAGIEHVDVQCRSVLDATFQRESFDLIICVNALYAMSPQEEVLQRVRRWMKPAGTFFVIDFGRRTRILDWMGYILGHILRQKGLIECLRFLRNSAESLRQNRRGSQGQADGTYWLHSTDEFGESLVKAGFHISELRTCYRNYCDLAVCTPKLSGIPPPP